MNCSISGDTSITEKDVPQIRNFLDYLIRNKFAYHFFLGNLDKFDNTIFFVLRELKEKYPQITYDVVLSELPKNRIEYGPMNPRETIIPGGVPNVSLPYNIFLAHRWLLDHADCILEWYPNDKFPTKENLTNKNQIVLNISDYDLTNPADCDKLNTILQKVR